MNATRFTNMPTIDIAAFQWDETGEEAGGKPNDRLLAVMSIGGACFHVEAYRVLPGDDIQEVAVCNDEIDKVAAALGADDRFQTVTIGEHEYVLIITPHCG